MKPTQEQVIAWAREAGFEDYRWTSLSGNSELDRTLQVGEYPVGESVFALAILAYEAGRKDENEACASLEVHLITPTRDYTIMSPLDCYEAALMDEAMAFRAAIRARREQ